ncbi:MAG: sugar dehydrogenase [Nitriliruptorales bacterium]|nr:sugar dehydrogenase [Nitriliruptorales bacterium]
MPTDASTARPTETTAVDAPTAAATERPRRQRRLRDIRIELEDVAQLEEPIAMAVRPDDDALYIAERAGRVRAVRGGRVDDEAVLDITDRVTAGGERGLLGIAFSPGGDRLYASYTNTDGDTRLDAYPMLGETAAAGRRDELLAVGQPYANHNGGNVVLGPDGNLYLGLGDGGSGGDPEGNAQNPGTLLGKLLRLDPEDGSAPGDNPFVGDERYQPEVFATGLRNPWRFSFDRDTGDLWIGDVGQNAVEEVNVTPAGDSAGRNFGWNLFEGSQPFGGDQPPPGYVEPVVEYPTGAEGCAVTGGYVYRGQTIPALHGAYLYSDYCGGWIRAVRVRDGEVVQEAELAAAEGVASFGEDAAGELYVLSLNGTVSRLVEQ